MSKIYTFGDCVTYANEHNIAFNFYYTGDLHCLYSDISDGADGYLTATQAIFEYDNFSETYKATMNLNIRYAYKKDYELMRRLEICINRLRYHAMGFCKATWNNGLTHWYGALCLNNEHYIAGSTIHGKEIWNM